MPRKGKISREEGFLLGLYFRENGVGKLLGEVPYTHFEFLARLHSKILEETKSETMNIFRFFYFVFKSFVKVELSYVFTINLFTIAENCTEK